MDRNGEMVFARLITVYHLAQEMVLILSSNKTMFVTAHAIKITNRLKFQ